jgi:hypothetical protein
MKLACSSSLYDAPLAAGDLTQIEWIDLCARTLEVDGLVFGLRHFPRSDGEYLAQIKKMCADLGLTVAAVETGDLFAERREGSAWPAFEAAEALGAPLVLAGVPAPDPAAAGGGWQGMVGAAKLAARAAKAVNVTIAVRNAAESLCETSADLKRLAKEVDSAWLRFGVDPAALEGAAEIGALLGKTVIVSHRPGAIDAFGADQGNDVATILRSLRPFRGFFCIGAGNAPPDAAEIPRFVSWLHAMRAKEALQPAGTP